MQVIRRLEECSGKSLSLWKADIDAAFRRIPLAPHHRNFAYVVFLFQNRPVIAGHMAAMFGGVSSVFHWERVGELVKSIARRLLHLPVLRFVDDYFAPEHEESAAHAMGIFVRYALLMCTRMLFVRLHSFARYRLVRSILGKDAIAQRKVEVGNPLTVLGVQVEINLGGIVFTPDEGKVQVWKQCIRIALQEGRLTSGEASKLAGTRTCSFLSHAHD